MNMYCDFHKEKHEDYQWKSFFRENRKTPRMVSICHEALRPSEPMSDDPFFLGVSKTDARVGHWKEIKKRITTHEGEVLSGDKGAQYQQKYGRLIGITPRPTDFSAPEYQRELVKK